MSMARLVITAVSIEGRSKSEVARDYGISRVWICPAAGSRSRSRRNDPDHLEIVLRRPAQRTLAGRHRPLVAGR
jgi:hypothetical protein